jgi:NAD-dependent dihydropyrimidine dehydrogenase PreA subunit
MIDIGVLPAASRWGADDSGDVSADVFGAAVITEACLDVKDRACVDVCPVQCIYEFDEESNTLVSEAHAGSGTAERTHEAHPRAAAVFGASLLYVKLDECTSCAACYQPSVCPVGAIYAEGQVPDGTSPAKYNANDPHTGHNHSWFAQHSRNVFVE